MAATTLSTRSTTEKDQRVWRREPPTWLALGAALLFGLTLFSWTGFDRILQRDEAIFAYASVTVADGHPPYVAAFDNTGPLGPMVGGAGAWLGRGLGVHDLTAIRAAYLAVSVLTITILFLATRRLFRSNVYALISVVSLLTLGTFTRHAAGGPRPKLLVVLFVVLALWAVAERWWLVAGAASALSALAWQAGIVIFIVVVIMALVEPPRRRSSAAATAMLGLTIPFAVTALAFAAVGAFEDLWESAVVYNLVYLDRAPASLAEGFLLPMKGTVGAHQLAWPILVGGLLVLVGRLTVAVTHRRWLALWRDDFTPWGMAVLLFGAWTLYDYQGVIDLYPLLALAAVGAALGIRGVALWAGWERGWGHRAAVVAVLTVLAVAASIRVNDNALHAQRADLTAFVAEEDRMAVIGSPQALVALDRRSPNRYTFVFPSTVAFMDDHDDGGFEGYVASLIAFEPDVVVTDAKNRHEEREELAPVFAWLNSEYQRVAGDFFVFWVR